MYSNFLIAARIEAAQQTATTRIILDEDLEVPDTAQGLHDLTDGLWRMAHDLSLDEDVRKKAVAEYNRMARITNDRQGRILKYI